MDENAYLRQRTDEILRQRIALGMTGAGVRRKRSGSKTVKKRVSAKRRSTKKCPTRKPIARKAHMRAGRRVKASCARRPRRRAGEGIMAGEEEMLDLYDSVYGRGEGVMAGVVRKRGEKCKSPLKARKGYKRKDGVRVRPSCVKPRSSSSRSKPKARKSRSKSSAWIEHVRQFAADHGINYSEALKDPRTRKSYHAMNAEAEAVFAAGCGPYGCRY